MTLFMSISPASEGCDHQPGRCSASHPRGATLQEESDAQVCEATPSQGRPSTSCSCFYYCQVSESKNTMELENSSATIIHSELYTVFMLIKLQATKVVSILTFMRFSGESRHSLYKETL